MAYGHGLPHSSPLSISGGLRKRHRPPPPEVPEGVLVKIKKKAGSGPSRGFGDERGGLGRKRGRAKAGGGGSLKYVDTDNEATVPFFYSSAGQSVSRSK